MLEGLTMSVLSLLKFSEEHLDIVVVTAKADDRYEALTNTMLIPLKKEVAKMGSHLRLVDITDEVVAEYPTANADSIFTVNCMLRLYLDKVPGLSDRVLYLDTDVICRKDFGDFYHQALDRYDFAGCLDYYGKWFFHHRFTKNGFDYVNSGVLLFNMKRAKEDRLFERCRELCANKKMFLPDQSALNRLAKKKYVNHRYNDQRRLHPNRTVFQHFTTSFRFYPTIHTVTVKPWEEERLHSVLHLHDYDKLIAASKELMEKDQAS